MGNVNSTPTTHHAASSSPPAPSSSGTGSGSSVPLPSVDDLRNMTHRILAATGDSIHKIRENIPTIDIQAMKDSASYALGSSQAKTLSSSSSEVLENGTAVLVTDENAQVLIFDAYSGSGAGSTLMLIKVHYRLTANWVKKNFGTILLTGLALGLVVGAGVVAFKNTRAQKQRRRQLRILRGPGGAKREIVVISQATSPAGQALALNLESQGFIVFAGVQTQAEVETVQKWAKADIHPVLYELNKLSAFVGTISAYLDQKNGEILSGSSAGSLLSVTTLPAVIYQEELSSSIANIRLVNPEPTLKGVVEAEGKKARNESSDVLYRVSAVIVNPNSVVQGSIEKVDLNEWRKALDTNVTGTVAITQKFIPLLRRTLALQGAESGRGDKKRSKGFKGHSASHGPKLILMSSAVTGSISLPNQSAVCASHHALESVADSLRREVGADGIQVVCLQPGILHHVAHHRHLPTTSSVGLFGNVDPYTLFTNSTTSTALCEATVDAIVASRPSFVQRVGGGSLTYAFVGWAIPRRIVDWSIRKANTSSRLSLNLNSTSLATKASTTTGTATLSSSTSGSTTTTTATKTSSVNAEAAETAQRIREE